MRFAPSAAGLLGVSTAVLVSINRLPSDLPCVLPAIEAASITHRHSDICDGALLILVKGGPTHRSLDFITAVLQFIKAHKYLSFRHSFCDFKMLAMFEEDALHGWLCNRVLFAIEKKSLMAAVNGKARSLPDVVVTPRIPHLCDESVGFAALSAPHT